MDSHTNNKNKNTEGKENSIKLDINFKKIEKYQSALQKYLEIRVKCKAVALELTQDTFERYINIESPEKIEFPRAFLFRIASNLAMNHLRREKIYVVQAEAVNAEQSVFTREPSPDEWAQYEETQHKFKIAYEALSLKSQEIFYLRRFSELSTQEISLKLGISQRMVQKYLINIMQHFHQQLK